MRNKRFDFRGQDFDIEYDFYPKEREYFDHHKGVGHPGSPAFVELNSMSIGECELIDLLSKDAIDLIENTILLGHLE